MAENNPAAARLARACIFASAIALAGCASTESTVMGSGSGITASDPTRMTRTGFLTDYAALRPVPDGGGVMCWRAVQVSI